MDRTGLKGRYDFRIDIKPYLTAQGDAGGGKERSGELDPISLLFTDSRNNLTKA
jgi:hypothetical protein